MILNILSRFVPVPLSPSSHTSTKSGTPSFAKFEAASFTSNQVFDVCVWHFSDMRCQTDDVRSLGQSKLGGAAAALPPVARAAPERPFCQGGPPGVTVSRL